MVILAFPANNFGGQEPGTNVEIQQFCAKKDVTFPLFAKISVKGEDCHPLYRFLTSKETNHKFAGDIKWNFQKFLIDATGQVIARYEPSENPMGEKVLGDVANALKDVPAAVREKIQKELKTKKDAKEKNN